MYEQEEEQNAAVKKVGDRIISRDSRIEKAQSYYHSTEDKNNTAEIVALMNLALNMLKYKSQEVILSF